MAVKHEHAPSLVDMAEAALYTEWKKFGPHVEEYACELVGTCLHIFALVCVVGLMFSPHSPVPGAIPSKPLRLLLAGMMIGGSGALVAISPLGRLSGAHLNPAISFGFWMQGRMHTRDFAAYCFSQLVGAALGTAAAVFLFPSMAQSISDAVLRPATGLSAWSTFGLEVAATFILATVIFSFVASKRFMRYTPAAIPFTAGFLVWWDGALSGAGLNPARWFGPAVCLPEWHLGWAYVLGPMAGAFFAAFLRLHPEILSARPKTSKLFHDPRYRSIFKHDAVASTPPAHLTDTAG